MFVVFVAAGIASGKSTVARMMCEMGARRLDLDDISREVLSPGSELVGAIAREFGSDLVDEDGALDRRLLAERALATPEDAARLEALEIPVILDRLEQALGYEPCVGADDGVVVVEVPLLDRMGQSVGLADAVLAVVAPYELRRERAVARGMDVADFEARAANQPSDEWLVAHADDTIVNDGDEDDLATKVRAWWDAHVGAAGAEVSHGRERA